MMISLQTDIEGKIVPFGAMRKMLRPLGYVLCGNWDYDRGKFDCALWREDGETIYLRLPFHVTDGELDRDDARIQFRTPYVIKHVVNLGLDRDDNSLLSVTGLAQFQKPLDTDGHIKHENKWERIGKQSIEQIMDNLNELSII